MDWDLIVVGGGAAGLGAAREAARLQARVVLVTDGPPGGDCTFTGCVPSKALIAAAGRGRSFDEAMRSARRVVEVVAATEDATALRAERIEVVRGRATFVTPTAVDCAGQRLRALRFVVATGSHPAVPVIAGLETVGYLTNETIFDLDRRPRRLAVIGGGPEGCELAQAFSRMGSEVTLLESADRILPAEEPETSAVVAAALSADGVRVRTASQVRAASLEPVGTVLTVHSVNADPYAPEPRTGIDPEPWTGTGIDPDGPRTRLEVDAVVVATGRRVDVSDLGLTELGLVTDAGAIRVDERLATAVAGIWAAGDVTAGPRLTHVADEMGRVAAHNALAHGRFAGRARRFDRRALPQVVFTDPEVGRVGITEARSGPDARVAYLPMAAVDRAVITGRAEGFVKLIAGPRALVGHSGGGRLLGATVVSPAAGEVIHEAALAVRTGMFAGRLAQTVHAYPSWSMALRQAAAQLVTRPGAHHARPARPESQA